MAGEHGRAGGAGEPDSRKRRGAGLPGGTAAQSGILRGEGGIGKDYERNRFLSDPGAGRCFRDDCGENCGIDCGDSGDQLFEPHGRSRTWCRACGAVDLDFLCGGVLLSGDTLGECMHEADPGRSGTRMAEGKQSGIAVIEECIVKDERKTVPGGAVFLRGELDEKKRSVSAPPKSQPRAPARYSPSYGIHRPHADRFFSEVESGRIC